GDRDVEASLLSARELQDARVPLLLQPDHLDDLIHRARMRVVLAKQIDGLGHREVWIDPRGLQDDPDPGLERPFALRRIVAQHANLAAGAIPKAFHDLHRRGLARSVRTEKSEYLPAAHGEVDPANGMHVAVGLREPFDFDGEGVHGRSLRAPTGAADRRTRIRDRARSPPAPRPTASIGTSLH